jgi:hypothetical protein
VTSSTVRGSIEGRNPEGGTSRSVASTSSRAALGIEARDASGGDPVTG